MALTVTQRCQDDRDNIALCQLINLIRFFSKYFYV